jgi:hypothetical protein
MAHETARAGPRSDAETGPQDAAMRGGLQRPDTANHEATQDDLAWSPDDRHLANGGLSDCEMALLECPPVASDAQMHARLWALGVRDMASLYVEPVLPLQNRSV